MSGLHFQIPAKSARTRSAAVATPKLSQAALILLGQAAARPDGMVLPPPAGLRARGGALHKVLQALLKAGLVIERPVDNAAQSWRSEGERFVGLAITAEGFGAIGMPPPAPLEVAAAATPDAGTAVQPLDAAGGGSGGADADDSSGAPEAKRITKASRLVGLLSGDVGQSIAELAETLTWQNHTVRAALTGLRQKGYAITKAKTAEGTTVYRIAAGQCASQGDGAPGAARGVGARLTAGQGA